MRIGVDARCLNTPHVRGMGRYLLELIEELDRQAEIEWRMWSNRPDWPFHPPQVERLEAEQFDLRGYRFHRWEQWALPQRARLAKVDVLLCPGTTLPWWQPIPTVVTLHDTIPWDGEEGDQRWYWHGVLPRAYRKCAAIITPSQSAASDIVARWPRLERKITVVPHGIGAEWLAVRPSQLSASLVEAGVRTPYLVYLGGTIPRKRLAWAIEVLARLADLELQLVVCGIERENRGRVLEMTPEKVRGQLCFPGFVPAEAMPALIQRAATVLYPTLYEGFGFPVIEAQAVGTPILFSPLGSLAELQGPGAVVLPPEDLDAWVAACRRVIAERRDGVTPNKAARKWAAGFSWTCSAELHLEVLRAVARTGRTKQAVIA